MRFADVDAVTFDAFGTLVELVDPRPALERALDNRGVERGVEAIGTAFADEVAYYRPRAVEGRDPARLARLRTESAAVFLDRLDAKLDPEEFAQVFVDCLVFRLLPGVKAELEALGRLGLTLGVVANWDVSLDGELERLGIARMLAAVVTSAAVGTAKPDPAIFRVALERLSVEPARTLHIGDRPEDEHGATRAGLHFAPAPLATALQRWR